LKLGDRKVTATNRVALPTKLVYGFGAVAYGVKNNGFDYFLLLFYSQVMGVDAPLVGLALLIALLFDAVSDPVVGYLSDNTHTRWGRRHPWMYASAIPVSICYYLLWVPPTGLTGNELFPYILTLSILIRVCITLFEVPSSALAAELTEDYDERTSLISFRYFFGWIGGTIMATIALAVFLAPTETIPNGILNKQGYTTYGIVASTVILISILATALGTHRHIPNFKLPPPKKAMSVKRILSEVYETLANRSFLAMFLAALFGAAAMGLYAGLTFYISGYFWGFSADQISGMAFSIVLSALVALFMAPIISRRIGKKRGAITIGVLAFTIAPAPVVLRLIGIMPENGDPILYPIILVATIIDIALMIIYSILSASMIADLVEDGEIRTARRSEGVLFAATTFTRKAVQGFGVLAATVVLTAAEFPKGVAPGQVSEEAVFRLGLFYAPTLFVIWMLGIASLSLYRIDRDAHENNLKTLADRA
jgi:GPH family glycoside/pentoside/hexuronide:cation symporter